MKPTDITSRRAQVLSVLGRQEYPTIREISEFAGLPRSTVQTSVIALIRHGLAVQSGSASSGGATFDVTEAGQAWLDRHAGAVGLTGEEIRAEVEQVETR